MAKRFLTVKEVVEEVSLSERSVRDKLERGEIKGVKFGGKGKWLIPTEEVERLLGRKGSTKLLPLGELVELLQRWREQAQFSSFDELLRRFGSAALREHLLRRVTDSDRVTESYDAAKRHHVKSPPERMTVSVSVEREGLFHRLRQCLPDDPVWEAHNTWDLAYSAYLEAFTSWCDEVEHDFELYLALALKEELRERGRQVASGVNLLEQIKKEDVNWDIFLRLASAIVSCDLLVLGIQELSASPLWFFQVDRLKILRGEVVSQIATLPKDLWMAQSDIGAAARLLWEHEPKVQEDTKNLLQKLLRLQAAQDDIRSKLTALECSLYDVAEPQEP